MSTPEDKVKAKQEKEKEINQLIELHNIKRNEEQKKLYEELHEKYKEELLNNPKLLNKPQDVNFDVSSPKKGFLKDIIEDYEKLPPGDRKASEKDGVVSLSFNSKDEAVNFFKAQADKGREFDAYCAEENHRVYSDGKGLFVQGTYKEVEQYLENPENYNVDKKGMITQKEPESQKTLSS